MEPGSGGWSQPSQGGIPSSFPLLKSTSAQSSAAMTMYERPDMRQLDMRQQAAFLQQQSDTATSRGIPEGGHSMPTHSSYFQLQKPKRAVTMMKSSGSDPSLLNSRMPYAKLSQEDDIFSSVGGLEMGQEGDAELVEHASTSYDRAVEPSRLVLVKGVPLSAPDEELSNMFQSFGEVQRLYTASRQRGLLLVVYYDLRSALAAAKRLQGYQVNGSPLELHFAAPKTVNGLDDCTVQIFNLDPDTTNEHLGWLLSKFGEVKGITESPNRRNQKFISFYDVRHATAAHKAMNRAELLTNLPADMTVQQVAHLSQIPEPAPNLLEIAAQMQSEPENVQGQINALISQGWDPNAPGAVEGLLNIVARQNAGSQPCMVQQGASKSVASSSGGDLQQLSSGMQNLKYNMELASNCALHISDSASSIANVSGNTAQLFGGNNSPVLIGAGLSGLTANRAGHQQHPKLAPLAEVENMSSNMANMAAMNNLAGMNMANLYHNAMAAVASNQSQMLPSQMTAAEAANMLLNMNMNDQQQLWASQMNQLAAAGQQAAAQQGGPGWPNMYMHPGSIASGLPLPGLQGMSLSQLQELQQRQQQQQMALANLAQLQAQAQDLSSANINAANLAAAQLLQVAGLGNLGGASGQNYLQHGLNSAAAAQLLQQACMSMPHALAPMPSSASGGGLSSSRHGSGTSLASLGMGGQGRQEPPRSGGRLSRRNTDPAAEQERRAQQDRLYALDMDKIRAGEDRRTTLMIKNIPNKYTQKMLLATVDEHFRGTYDFFYLPIDFKNKCNVGYAFVNMITPLDIIPLTERFNQKKWERFNSEKVCHISYARIQGRAALISHFQNSSLMHEDKRCRPILFSNDGSEVGDQEPFPAQGVRPRSGNNSFRDASTSSDKAR